MSYVSCINQECCRFYLLLQDAIKLGKKEYVLSQTDGYFVKENLTEVEDYFLQREIQLTKKYKKTEDSRATIYTLTC